MQAPLRPGAFSALGRAVWDETDDLVCKFVWRALPFSALGRAVWDETSQHQLNGGNLSILSVLSVEPYGMKPVMVTPPPAAERLSVLSVEPYGMKHVLRPTRVSDGEAFSALGRAVWDETAGWRKARSLVLTFSALGRAVWDETVQGELRLGDLLAFQCSRSSRMG